MTRRGAERLREELQQLKGVERPRIVAAIAEARAHGDLRENAEYHAAREQQSFVEGRIREIEERLSHADVIDLRDREPDGRVVFGATVRVEDTDRHNRIRYEIVGVDESDLEQGRLSHTSPLARALIGREEGDVVEVVVPGGVLHLEIIEVCYE
jgi:transcription elongation factor GreA